MRQNGQGYELKSHFTPKNSEITIHTHSNGPGLDPKYVLRVSFLWKHQGTSSLSFLRINLGSISVLVKTNKVKET